MPISYLTFPLPYYVPNPTGAPMFTPYTYIERKQIVMVRSAVVDKFDAGWESVRPKFPQKIVKTITDIYTMPDSEYAVMEAFLDGQGYEATPFWYWHPQLGLGLVRWNSNDVQADVAVDGNPSWYQVTAVFRGVFG